MPNITLTLIRKVFKKTNANETDQAINRKIDALTLMSRDENSNIVRYDNETNSFANRLCVLFEYHVSFYYKYYKNQKNYF